LPSILESKISKSSTRSSVKTTDTPFSARLKLKLDLVFPVLSASNQSFLDREQFPERLTKFLLTVHAIIRASVPLMDAAKEECEKRRDLLSEELANYYREHSKEELHHDEWLLEDLELLGLDGKKVLGTKPSNAAAELAGIQYYWIHHLHPCSLLGYILVLEGYPMSADRINQLIAKTGFPTAAFRTLMEHSSLDVNHARELDRILDCLPLSPQQEEWISLNSIYTIRKCAEIMDSM
jgi:pyrroloquinoline quinone (PQQ) biosynthesis protein C